MPRCELQIARLCLGLELFTGIAIAWNCKSDSMQPSGSDGTLQVCVESRRQDKHILHQRIACEERCDIQHLEVDGTVNGVRRVEELRANLQRDLRRSSADADSCRIEVIDRSRKVHPLQTPIVFVFRQYCCAITRSNGDGDDTHNNERNSKCQSKTLDYRGRNGISMNDALVFSRYTVQVGVLESVG
jgi:hypothetical protein